LEKAGLVQRVDCPEDARGVVAEITQKGEDALATAAPTHVDGVRTHLIDHMSDDEQSVIAAVFERVIARLDPS
jgi:DNA-binding MarR family transcriptional regulator